MGDHVKQQLLCDSKHTIYDTLLPHCVQQWHTLKHSPPLLQNSHSLLDGNPTRRLPDSIPLDALLTALRGSSGGRCIQLAPSTTSVSPVTNDAALEHRNTQAMAMSHLVPQRPSGIMLRAAFVRWASSAAGSSLAVPDGEER